MDAPVTPGRVLLCQPQDQRRGSRRQWWPAGPAVWVGPAPGHEVSVPAPQAGRLDEPAVLRLRARNGHRAERTARSAGCSAGRRIWRRSTVTSWRSMTTSIARSVSLRPESRISWRTRQNARYRNDSATAECSPHQALDLKVQLTAHGWRSRHPHPRIDGSCAPTPWNESWPTPAADRPRFVASTMAIA